MTVSVSSQPPTAKKSARRKKHGVVTEQEAAAPQVIQLWNVVPQRTVSAPTRQIELETRAFVAIGRFITAFSQLEFFLKVALAGVLQIKEEHYNAVVGPYDFSMLCTVTSAIFKQEAPEREADIEKVLSRCRALNNHRVRIAHGVWLHESYGLKARHISRQSLKPEFYYHDSEELERLTETAQQLKVEVIALWATASKN